jgi:hypothetical protein
LCGRSGCFDQFDNFPALLTTGLARWLLPLCLGHDHFPDPATFVATAKRLNYRIDLWEHAFTRPRLSPRSLAPSALGRPRSLGGLVPEFAEEPAREAFGNFRCKTLVDKGISSFKLDECNKLPSGTQPIPPPA